MSQAGYSGTPLTTKLGIREGDRVAIVGDPGHAALLLEPLLAGVELVDGLSTAEVVIFFTTEHAALAERIRALGEAIYPNGACWIAWPKKSAKAQTDVTENVVRDVALPLGLVDNKVCAVDATWSGLRLVWRKELRTAR